MTSTIEVVPFRYKDARTGKWVKACYKAERHKVAAGYAEWEIIDPGEVPPPDRRRARCPPNKEPELRLAPPAFARRSTLPFDDGHGARSPHEIAYKRRWPTSGVAVALAAWLAVAGAGAQTESFLTDSQRAEDFASFCRFVEREYAYFDIKHVDWKRACSANAGDVASATTRDDYIALLERTLGELYDHHAHLGTNTRRSPRLVPSQSDVTATWVGSRAIVVAVRTDSAAERAGLRRGMQVMAIDGQSVETVVDRIAPTHLAKPDAAARTWALNVALAGHHERPVIRLNVQADGRERDIEFAPAYPAAATMLTFRKVGEIGHVRIHNALGQLELVAEFDRALTELRGVRALVLDLRDTPSGGNTTVARGIMSRFVAKTMPYQRHEAMAEFRETGIRRVWVEEVAPRKSPVRVPLVVLVGPWTGSMGEGLAIGLNAARGAPVLGETMARLLGALGQTELPHSKIVVRIPTEKLAHVNGTPRESFVPRPVPPSSQSGRDEDLDAAIALAMKLAVDRRAADPVAVQPQDARRPP